MVLNSLKIVLLLFVCNSAFAQNNCYPLLSEQETNFDSCNGSSNCIWNWNLSGVSILNSFYEDINNGSLYVDQLSPNGNNYVAVGTRQSRNTQRRYNSSGHGFQSTRVAHEEADGSPHLTYNFTGLDQNTNYKVEFYFACGNVLQQYSEGQSIPAGYWSLNGQRYGLITPKRGTEWYRGVYHFNTRGENNFTLNFAAIHISNPDGLFNLLLDGVYAYKTGSNCETIDCEGFSSFNPTANKKYVLSAWVREKISAPVASYTHSSIDVLVNGTMVENAQPSGVIIDGWQKIEKEFEIPENASVLDVKLKNSHTDKVYFDDIRIHPFDGNMKSFVYDPETQRLVAELDENNYATFYEYDQEGGLIRVKKENYTDA